MVYARKVITREELLQQNLSAARSINNAAELRKFFYSESALELNPESVTLTPGTLCRYRNICYLQLD